MPLLPAPRAPPCLFCAVAARLPRPPAARLGPRIQTANRAATAASKRAKARRTQASIPRSAQAPRLPFHIPLRARNRHGDTGAVIRDQLDVLRDEFRQPEYLESLQLDRAGFDQEWRGFESAIDAWLESPELLGLVREAARGKATLATRIQQRFFADLYAKRFTAAELDNQKEVADLRYPAEWYPATRQLPRTVHMHVGPTNSGKTYHALKRLEEAKSGIYLGPLRLLAHEVYTRLNAKGKPCALVTGEEQRMPDGASAAMYSCTVEMAPLNTKFDVAVIDEIQMINHNERGWAWTQAFLGLQASEIHLCGEARTVPLMRELCALVGDKVHVHEYERLTPLQVEPQSLRGKLGRLEKGDCVVAFTVIGIHTLRREIEKRTGKKCAIVYGSLPPETRAQQARLFNDPENDYDYLVASDAIGMGLNLAIKRVIFESTIKSNGVDLLPLEVSEVKQIAGRAGRYKTAHQAVTTDTQTTIASSAMDPAIGLDDQLSSKEPEAKTVGWVTTLDDVDHAHLRLCMKHDPPVIKTAGIFPPSLVVERFANYFPPGTPFSYIMLRLHEISNIHPRFHLCALKDQLSLADAIHTISNLSIQDRITICAAPISMRNPKMKAFLRELAKCIAEGKSGSLLDFETLPLQNMDKPITSDRSYLASLEDLHKMLVCYLWLSYRFPNVFITRSLANYTKKLVEDQIEDTLTAYSFTEKARKQMKKRRETAHHELKDREEGQTEQLEGDDSNSPLGMPVKVKCVKSPNVLHDPRPGRNDVDVYPEDRVSIDHGPEPGRTGEVSRSNM
ncbi:P-loop containing nucleoside triphosphate hydrolase protein [Ampelomyces quisqualis]|uniref:RNA helicase n=1 Tax=Ampelomyces quisqualis TaxID=50730 RepID=A0A6A5R169_AMPQU|nr:P-loop containing nucleoside triphosphate hydrolase protein [Ampelomyces quisqualis]